MKYHTDQGRIDGGVSLFLSIFFEKSAIGKIRGETESLGFNCSSSYFYVSVGFSAVIPPPQKGGNLLPTATIWLRGFLFLFLFVIIFREGLFQYTLKLLIEIVKYQADTYLRMEIYMKYCAITKQCNHNTVLGLTATVNKKLPVSVFKK